MNPLAKDLIQHYQLEAHPEGGYFKETLRADTPLRINNRIERPLYTSILFLLDDKDVSHFHTLQSDELWLHHQGDRLDVICIDPQGHLEIIHLGQDEDCVLQAVVKANTCFGSYLPQGGTALVGCVVAPGFLYSEFVLHSKDELLKLYPQYPTWIELLGHNKGNL